MAVSGRGSSTTLRLTGPGDVGTKCRPPTLRAGLAGGTPAGDRPPDLKEPPPICAPEPPGDRTAIASPFATRFSDPPANAVGVLGLLGAPTRAYVLGGVGLRAAA